MAFLGALGAGGYGLQLLTKELTKYDGQKLGDKAILVYSIANVLMLAAASIAANTYTVVGNWTDALDRWSRSNGFADAAMMGLFSVCLLWPFVVLLMVRRVRDKSQTQ